MLKREINFGHWSLLQITFSTQNTAGSEKRIVHFRSGFDEIYVSGFTYF